MCWRNDVQWVLHADDDPKKFMTVTSGEYVLAIPDYSHQARSAPEHQVRQDADSVSSGSSRKNAAIFKKVIMKVSGKVKWTAGLVFERDLPDGERSFEFQPHYDVILKNPKHMQNVRLEVREDCLLGTYGLTSSRTMTLFEGSGAITFTCQLPSPRHLIATGQLAISNRLTATTQSI